VVKGMGARRSLAGTLAGTMIAVWCGVGAPAPAGAQSTGVSLDGAGDSFAQPFLGAIGPGLSQGNDGFELDYLAVGSDAKDDFAKGDFDFVVDQVPLTAAQVSALNASGRGFAYAPLALGAVAFPYNLRPAAGSDARITDLKLSPKTLTAIFSGSVGGGALDWENSPEIIADNGGKLTVNDSSIRRVTRLDASGTTALLTAWFLTVDRPTWVAFTTQVKAPNPDQPQWTFPDNGGAGRQNGDSAVVDSVAKQVRGGVGGFGSIGYASSAYTTELKVPTVRLKNSSGAFVAPTADAMEAAIRSSTVNADNVVQLDFDPPAAAAYPLTVVSYAIVPTTGLTAAKRAALVKFLRTAATTGQDKGAAIGYAPLPKNLSDLTLAVADRLVAGGPAAAGSSSTTSTTTAVARTAACQTPASTTSAPGAPATTASGSGSTTTTNAGGSTTTTRAGGAAPRIAIRSVAARPLAAAQATTSTTSTTSSSSTSSSSTSTSSTTAPTTSTTVRVTTTIAAGVTTPTTPCPPVAPTSGASGGGTSLALTGAALAVPIALLGLASALGGEALRRRARSLLHRS